MATNEIRQSSVIQGSGPGSLTVLQEGMSVMISGLDAWYKLPVTIPASKDDGLAQLIYKTDIPKKCRLSDPKLENTLQVEFFAVPPAVGVDSEAKHSEAIPVTVFPCWTICYNCRALEKIESVEQLLPNCKYCASVGNKKRKVVQTNFVIACENGHIDEFPWRMWVHKGERLECKDSRLEMYTAGSGDLKGQKVVCTKCNSSRNLANTNSAEEGSTYLSKNLYGGKDHLFTCTGRKPWLEESDSCDLQVRMVLRSASNLYYTNQYSSIFVPIQTEPESPIDEVIDQKSIQLRTKLLIPYAYNYGAFANYLKFEDPDFGGFDVSEIEARLRARLPQAGGAVSTPEDQIKSSIKNPEWEALNRIQENESLRVRDVGYAQSIAGVDTIHAVPTLVKTTALAGFSRLLPKAQSIGDSKSMLRRATKNPRKANWLPAVQYVGEGIFIKLDDEKLAGWEAQLAVKQRVAKIKANLERFGRENPDEPTTARRVLLHTLAHVLIQELVLECGYIAASLSERIYSDEKSAGILIYTSSPDADGTMGGLVEMARPDALEKVFSNAIEKAMWCSNDPVCMELGKEGQGNLGTNLAACHNCCLLPETACDHFNQALDRALLVGDTTDPSAFFGYFN